MMVGTAWLGPSPTGNDPHRESLPHRVARTAGGRVVAAGSFPTLS